MLTLQDISYFAGSIFYLLAALRDAGWLWWAPEWYAWLPWGLCNGRAAWAPVPCAPGTSCYPEHDWKEWEERGQAKPEGLTSASALSGAGKDSTGSVEAAHDGSLKLYTYPGAAAVGGGGKGKAHFTMRSIDGSSSASGNGAAKE